MKQNGNSPMDDEEFNEYLNEIEHLISLSVIALGEASDKIKLIRRTVETNEAEFQRIENKINHLISLSAGALSEAHKRFRVNGQTVYPDEAGAVYQIRNNIRDLEPVTIDAIRKAANRINTRELLAHPDETTVLNQIQSDTEAVALSIRNRRQSGSYTYCQPPRISELLDELQTRDEDTGDNPAHS